MAEVVRKLLSVKGLEAGYGQKKVLSGISVDVAAGEIVAIVGHNGAGKSTFLRAVFGVLPMWAGTVELDGTSIGTPTPVGLLHAGVAYVPQGNRVFPDLTVRENLEVGCTTLLRGERLAASVERAFTLFPVLAARAEQRAGSLSGGEKQMLALANVLILSPRLLLLDEPSLGLAPPLVAGVLQRIQQMSRDSGAAVLIVEQKIREVLKIASRVYVFRGGTVSFSGPTQSLADVATLRSVFL